MKKSIEKEEIEKLINEGISLIDISKILNVSKSTIFRLCSKYGLKSKFIEKKNELINCLECNVEFKFNIKANRKFCSKKCSASFNSRDRIHTEETKIRISKSLKERNKKIKVIKNFYCKSCNINVIESKKKICDRCRIDYYKYYRPNSEFDFNIYDYEDKFDFSLVEKYGWYSPSNKGNNLNGVSRDHMFSVKDGFDNNVDVNIIKHPANCKLMMHKENNKKNCNSTITLEELLCRIKNW